MKYLNVVKKHGLKSVALVGTLVASSSSFAVTIPEAIDAAVTAGQDNYTTVVVGLIALAAIGFGLRSIVRAMNG